ncbi:MAG: hypothetical protein JO171_08840 [Paludibacterium sp.]|uniref:protein MIGRI n=1 Tax=Paludibacterium sp. TaxID=1917523 RepID=UPI0025F2663A|nr:hypothetical protein [Paludibacterium sp.]MBV8047245.1 hypothetical protein [Paludibacterium sp.]MBV8647918.1 hypothetical protein [Paludibacterium sp.]
MLGRLFKLLLLAGLATVLVRALLSPEQRAGLHRLFQTLAWALLVSAALMVALSLTRVVSL